MEVQKTRKTLKIMEKHKMFQIDDVEDLRLCEIIMKSYALDTL